MPVKLIGTMILLVIVTIFCGFNLDNKCDVNFVFYNFSQVPAFLTVLISFFAGVVVMIPFTIGKGKSKDVNPTTASKPSDSSNPKKTGIFSTKKSSEPSSAGEADDGTKL